MASRKIFHAKPNYIYPSAEINTNYNPIITSGSTLFEFDESDVWNSNEVASMDSRKPIPSSRSSKKFAKKIMEKGDRTGTSAAGPASASLPVNIPDWSKILKDDHRGHHQSDVEDDQNDDDDDDDDDDRIPPHEYLARRRGASFSVHEGIGRTLKGRDLRRVRNAIWKKTGFED